MSTFLSPGVFTQEVPSTPPITGVGTSTAAFIGAVASNVPMPSLPDGSGTHALAPVGEPRFVSSYDQFTESFGVADQANLTLAHAVWGFFSHGGTSLYVTRVSALSAGSEVNAALASLAAIDEIAIVAAPGASGAAASTRAAVADHCALLQDRFAILDGEPTTTISVATIGGALPRNEFAGLYWPWIVVNDLRPPAAPALTPRPDLTVPPSGHVAGIYARVDADRGVHKAPANEQVRGARGLQRQVSRGEHDQLNPLGVNVIRSFRGDIRVWGARTWGGQQNAIQYLSVRRTLSFIRESIEESTAWTVFEPNSRPLWERIKRSARDFLTTVWRDGALFGDAPEEAFYVKCDEGLNPPAVRDLGRVVTEIGVAIVRPAEFVVFRISQGAALPTP